MKRLILLTTLILLSYITSAAVLSEFSFADQGYNDYYIKDVNVFECNKYDFTFHQDLNALAFPILSVKAEFLPEQKNGAKIIVFLNDDNAVAEIKADEFYNGFARILVPREKIRADNQLRICGKTSFSTSQIKVSNESTFGVYKTSYFPKETGLRLELETYRPQVDVPFKIDAVARNYGSEDQAIKLSWRKDELEEALPWIQVLKGETSKTGTVEKCQKRDENTECVIPGEFRIGFTAVATKETPMTLLPAFMEFENVFGESVGLLSNRPTFESIPMKNELSVQVKLESDTTKAGNNNPIDIEIKNYGKREIKNILLNLRTGLEIIGNDSETFAISPGQEAHFSFIVKGIAPGKYFVGCDMIFEETSIQCQEAELLVEKNDLSTDLIAGTGFLLIALGVFVYFYFKK